VNQHCLEIWLVTVRKGAGELSLKVMIMDLDDKKSTLKLGIGRMK